MDGIYQAWQTGLLWVCLCALGAMAAWLFLAKVAAPAWDTVRRWWSLPCIQRILVGVCVVGLSYYGATKQGWHVGYDGGIKAGATANVVTNDTVSIHWQRDTSGGVYVPETATVYIDYRPNTETNAEWGLLAQTTVGAWGWSGTVENATNYDYNVWAYYIPPEPVHTNGVWTYKTHFDRNGEYALPLRARVEVNGVAIATPAEKRKDAVPTARDYIQDGLIAMWDGIENAGWGVHGANAPIDLVGSADLTSVGNTIIEADNFTAGVGAYFNASVPTFATAVKNKNFTLQIIVKNSRVSNSAICGIGNRGVWLYGSSRYNVSTLNILTSSYTQTPSINFYSDAKFSISILGGAVPKIRLNDSEVQAIYGSQTNVSPTDLLLGALNAVITNGSASFYSVRAYSRILTSEEIQHNYEIDKERFNLP